MQEHYHKKGHATKNFEWSELECKCGCGLAYIDAGALKKLQYLRDAIGRPLTINSAARCPAHNKAVGGKPASKHISCVADLASTASTAFDISTRGWSDVERQELHDLAQKIGFNGIGTYNTFIHVDQRDKRARW